MLRAYAAPAFPEGMHAEYFDVINSSLAIHTPEQFCAWTQGDLQHVFPHEMLLCGIGMIDNFKAHLQQLITCNLPGEYVQTLHQEGAFNGCPILAQWVKLRKPVLFDLADPGENTSWHESFNRHKLVNMAAHGQCDFNNHTTSYFSFSRVPGKLTPRHAYLLEMLVPHMHVALIRAIKGSNNPVPVKKVDIACLTEREQEVFHWLATGKTNWEISQVLKISEYTVKNHVQRILIKLKVNTRAQAVSKGLIARQYKSSPLFGYVLKYGVGKLSR